MNYILLHLAYVIKRGWSIVPRNLKTSDILCNITLQVGMAEVSQDTTHQSYGLLP